MNTETKQILVMGGAGYIGSHTNATDSTYAAAANGNVETGKVQAPLGEWRAGYIRPLRIMAGLLATRRGRL